MSDNSPIAPKEFLDLIHGPGAVIYFHVGNATWKNRPQTFEQAESKLRWRNAEGDGICFVVNAGGTKDKEIIRFNACFIDWDCGRDADGKYFPLGEVAIRKSQFFDRLSHSVLPSTSIIVETRNGYHVYWLLQSGVTSDQFRDCQGRLAAYLDTDPSVTNPARLMRLPGFNWTKSGYDPFPVSVRSFSTVRYSVQALLNLLPYEAGLNKSAIRPHNKCSVNTTTALIVVPDRPKLETTVQSLPEAIEYLKQQKLGEFLNIETDGKPRAVNCPFHSDLNASATIAYDDASRHWLFCCHSGNCGVKGSIIDIAQHLLQTTDAGEAIKYLMMHYGVTIDTGWKDEQKQILDSNIAVLHDIHTLSSRYPHLHRWIGRIIRDLTQKLKIARSLIRSERFQVNGQAIFFLSLREMQRRSRGLDELPRQFGPQSQRVDRYCLLGLMQKVPDADIPPHILQEAHTHRGSRLHRIQFYAFPKYTDDILRTANDRARLLIKAGVSVRAVSRQLVEDLFGIAVSTEVYPQRTQMPPDALQAFRMRVHALVMAQLDQHGYTAPELLLAALWVEEDWKTVTERRLLRVLPGILKENRLCRVTATKALKQRLSIQQPGYPRIIVRSLSFERDTS